VKEILLKQADVDAKDNRHWRTVLERFVRSGKDFESDYKATVQSVTAADVSNFLKNVVLSSGNHIKIVMMPEKK
jgi:zinc protease